MSENITASALHYFRVPRPQWELMLARVRQLGANAVYTPVPWHVHEFAPNRFDLTGLTSPRRNLKGFIDLCAMMGFMVVLDVSPIHLYDSLLNDGIPGWLLQQHPEITSQNAAGQSQNRPSLTHPQFLPFAKRWIQEISQTLLPQQHPAGPVQVQLGFKIDGLDYSDHVAAVQWPIWLRKRYADGGLDGLNAAYTPSTPYRSMSHVRLGDKLDSPAFKQDAADFAAYVQTETQTLYAAILREQGWQPLDAPLPAPRHIAHINPDAPDIGQSFRWASDAPLRIDGTPRYAFWQLKELNLPNELSPNYQILYTPPTEQTLFEVRTQTTAFRLLLNGKLEPATVAADGRLAYAQTNRTGRTDFYFTVPDAAAPVSGYLLLYLRSLLNGQRHALNFVHQRLTQLQKAMEPAPSLAAPAPENPVLSEAQAALTEANYALRKAAASIGALEDAFTTALNKEQTPLPGLPFTALNAETILPVKQAGQTAIDRLTPLLQASLPATLSPADYKKHYTAAVNVAIEVMVVLQEALTWLRENLSANELPPVNWAAHAHLETILKTLAAGVLRS